MVILGIAAKMPEKGYDLQELQFEKTVNMMESQARAIRASVSGTINIHAPYYGTLATEKEQKVKDTIMRIIEALRIARIMRSKIIVVRAGFYAKKEPAEVYGIVRHNCERIANNLGKMKIGIETMGRQSQFGTIEEVMRLSRDMKEVVPVFNLANLHARGNGSLRAKADFKKIFELVEEPYCHVSGVKYRNGMGTGYCSLESSDFEYEEMAEAAAEFDNLSIICDGPNAKQDYDLLSKLFPS